jgi:hypothetical protein
MQVALEGEVALVEIAGIDLEAPRQTETGEMIPPPAAAPHRKCGRTGRRSHGAAADQQATRLSSDRSVMTIADSGVSAARSPD